MFLGQRAHLHGIVNDERRLYVLALTLFREYLVNEFPLTNSRRYRNIQLPAYFPEFGLLHAPHVNAGMLLDCLINRHTFVRGLKVYRILTKLCNGVAISSDSSRLQ